MPEENTQPTTPKRKYKERTKKPPSAPIPIIMPSPPMAPGTMAQIDKRLGELLTLRGQINDNIAQAQQTLVYWQTKAQQLQQEQQELLSLLRQLSGGQGSGSPISYGTKIEVDGDPRNYSPNQPLVPPTEGTPFHPYAPTGVPPGVGSIPNNPRNPAPNPGGNVAADIEREGGFR